MPRAAEFTYHDDPLVAHRLAASEQGFEKNLEAIRNRATAKVGRRVMSAISMRLEHFGTHEPKVCIKVSDRLRASEVMGLLVGEVVDMASAQHRNLWIRLVGPGKAFPVTLLVKAAFNIPPKMFWLDGDPGAVQIRKFMASADVVDRQRLLYRVADTMKAQVASRDNCGASRPVLYPFKLRLLAAISVMLFILSALTSLIILCVDVGPIMEILPPIATIISLAIMLTVGIAARQVQIQACG